MTYGCIRTGCRKTLSECDQGIVKQLNPSRQRAFLAILTHKSGISKDLCNTIRPLFPHGVDPHRLSKIIRILNLDHSFKIVKLMGKVNDVSTFNGLLTILNEYGDIRMQLLCKS
ncbi:hypothetical protein MFLAVUS_009977 [Mucor flavus]|uniref:Uncharacterized protein n=1 Tax=Mucor flavus TaxID=439312 RepID=A0ABP9ZBF4_9FUNG